MTAALEKESKTMTRERAETHSRKQRAARWCTSESKKKTVRNGKKKKRRERGTIGRQQTGNSRLDKNRSAHTEDAEYLNTFL